MGDPRFRTAWELVNEKRFDAAATLLQEILKDNPRHDLALLELGMLYARDPRALRKAAELFERALQVNPENDVALNSLLSTYGKIKSPGEAQSRLEQLNELYPGSESIALAYGRSMSNGGDFQGALPSLLKASHSQNPIFQEGAYSAMAKGYHREGNNEKAVEAYTRLIQLQEKALNEYRARGVDTHRLEREILTNQLDLASSLLSTHQFFEAERLLRMLSERAPDDERVLTLARQLQAAQPG